MFQDSITGKAIERASIAELEALLLEENPELNLDEEVERLEDHIDPFTLFRMLLEPLEGVKQSPKYHPEGDASTTASRCSSWPARSPPTTKSSFWPPCSMMWARRSIPSDHVVRLFRR